MQNKNLLNDSGLERSVLSGILNHGSDLFIDIEDILDTKDFFYTINQKIYSIIKYLVHDKAIEKFDIPTILAGAKFINVDKFDGDNKASEYLEALFDGSPTQENTKSIAVYIYKLSLARQANKCLNNIIDDVNTINGSEKIDDILKKIEEPIFEFTDKLNSNDNSLVLIHDNLSERLQELSKEPKDIVGLPTGFSNWDYCIGGGFRRGTVNVVGARAKVGKSHFCLNIARNIGTLGIPVLYLDTEMNQTEQQDRLTSLISGIDFNLIETGKFSTMEEESKIVWDSVDYIKKIPITHTNIAGVSMEQILSLTRRWLVKSVGLNDNGLAKPCIVIYDYLKLMNSNDLKGNIQETQLLGFLITALHNFAVKYGIPILATVQLNRDGVEKEGSEVISGSDRILWLCSNFSILKHKSQEDFIEDPPSNGRMKLIVCDTRFGSGLEKGNYINIKEDLSKAKMEEGSLFSQIVSKSFKNEKIK